jgi:hypothetical protein
MSGLRGFEFSLYFNKIPFVNKLDSGVFSIDKIPRILILNFLIILSLFTMKKNFKVIQVFIVVFFVFTLLFNEY